MNEKKKLLLIINPMAGKSGYRSGFADVMLTLSQGGYPISHVISACAVTSSVHDSHVISACSFT